MAPSKVAEEGVRRERAAGRGLGMTASGGCCYMLSYNFISMVLCSNKDIRCTIGSIPTGCCALPPSGAYSPRLKPLLPFRVLSSLGASCSQVRGGMRRLGF